MCAAALADGVTTIESAACEPEVVDLGEYLNRMGARITGLGTPFVRIEGVDRLQGAEHAVIPDRIEAATLMLAAAITGGRVRLENVCLAHLTAVVEKLREIGVEINAECGMSNAEWKTTDPAIPHSAFPVPHSRLIPQSAIRNPHSLTVTAAARVEPADIVALPYPGIPTDVQAQFMALLTVADGMSVVTDKVFPDRFLHAAELLRLGAGIRREGPTAVIGGVQRLSGACVMASDLRASAALVLAGLAAEGETIVRRIYHLDRGYERLEAKLNHLGADIRRIADEPANMPASLLPDVAISPPITPDAPHALRPPKFAGRAAALVEP
jgi:UDP-N-acetylglucosamine 1-carboxyvinyltransferase